MKLLATLLIGAACVAGAPAHAQREVERTTGSNIPVPKRGRIPDSVSYSEADRGRIAAAGVARCIVDSAPDKVKTALSLPFGKELNKTLAALAAEDCLSTGEVHYSATLFRGALFAELWRRRVAAEAKGQSWGPALDAYDPSLPVAADADPATKQQLGLLWFADCIVKRDRAAANDVVVRPIASKEQAEAYTRLIPNLSPCLLQGQEVKFSKPVLEGVLAAVLYRAPAAPKTVSGVQ